MLNFEYARRVGWVLSVCGMILVGAASEAADYRVNWSTDVERRWIGPEFWANPMEDWAIAKGRLTCTVSGANRNVHLLTRELGQDEGDLKMVVRTGLVNPKGDVFGGYVGFRVGAQDEIQDYRARAMRGKGLDAGITLDGQVFAGKAPGAPDGLSDRKIGPTELTLTATLEGKNYVVTIVARELVKGKVGDEIGRDSTKVKASDFHGSLALVADGKGARANSNARNRNRNQAPAANGLRNNAPVWFDNWVVSGSKVQAHADRAFGPVLWTQQAMSRGVMKMTAQFGPIGAKESQTARLQVKPADKADAEWQTIAEEKIETLSRVALFRVVDWDDSKAWRYRVAYTYTGGGGKESERYFGGQVRKDPVEKNNIVVAGFTGNKDMAFPNNEVAGNVAKINPDVLFFSGDQIYEDVGGYGIIRTETGTPENVDDAVVNFIRKQALYGWAFRDLLRNRPSVVLPDDHDVYQGNIWGNGGNPTSMADHDSGGFNMHPDFVNAVMRINTGHFPDPYDPTPMKQGINVYYTDMVYGRVSFAMLADRYFKSGPGGVLPPKQGRADHYNDPDMDPMSLDVPGAVLLGDRQLKFLDDWATDWRGADLKTVLSQTIFGNLANYHGGNQMFLTMDLDSNGWPQTGRHKAVDAIRKGFGFLYAGDQHLASIVQLGIDDWNDAGVSFCVPSIAAGYPRAWRPDKEGRAVQNRPAEGLANTGEYLDGFLNKVTVMAVANPAEVNRKGILLTQHDKTSGFGVVRFNKKARTMKMECYRLLVDVSDGKASNQFEGWPQTVGQAKMYARKAKGWLPTLKVSGLDEPAVVQVINEANDEVIYTLRMKGAEYRPRVFEKGSYTIRVGDQDSGNMKTMTGVKSGAWNVKKDLALDF